MTAPITNSHASTVRDDVDYQYYRDFGENKGQFYPGSTSLTIKNKNGEVLGPVFLKSDIAMPDLKSVDRNLGVATLIDPQYVNSVAHNSGYGSVQYGDTDLNPDSHHYTYKLVARNNFYKNNIHWKFDYHIPRLDKLVTEVAPVEMFKGELTNSNLKNKEKYPAFARTGTGKQYIRDSTTQAKTWLSDGYNYLTGGTVPFDSIDITHFPRFGGGGSLTNNPYGYLNTHGESGDSGSGIYIYDNEQKKWFFLGVLLAGTSNSNTWGMHRNNWLDQVMVADKAGVLENKVKDQEFDWVVDSTSSSTSTIATSSWMNTHKNDSKQTSSSNSETKKSVSELYSYKTPQPDEYPNEEPKPEFSNWSYTIPETKFENGMTVGIRDEAKYNSTDTRQRPDLEAGKTVRFAGEDLVLNLKQDINQGAGALNFDANVTIKSDNNATWIGAGLNISKDKTVTWQIKNPEGDRLSKIGEGTLLVKGTGNGLGDISIGDGTIIFDQQADDKGNQQAFKTVGIVSGRPTLVINNSKQIDTNNTYFGFRGGRLDVNGNDLDFERIQHTDSGAKIVNHNTTKSSNITIKGIDSFSEKDLTFKNWKEANGDIYEYKFVGDYYVTHTLYFTYKGGSASTYFPRTETSNDTWEFIGKTREQAIATIIQRKLDKYKHTAFVGSFGELAKDTESNPSLVNGELNVNVQLSSSDKVFLLTGESNLNGTLNVKKGTLVLSGEPTPHARDVLNNTEVMYDDWMDRSFYFKNIVASNDSKLNISRNVVSLGAQSIELKDQTVSEWGYKDKESTACYRSWYTGTVHCSVPQYENNLADTFVVTNVTTDSLSLSNNASLSVYRTNINSSDFTLNGSSSLKQELGSITTSTLNVNDLAKFVALNTTIKGNLSLTGNATAELTKSNTFGNVSLTDNSSTNLNNLNVNGSISLANKSSVTITNAIVNGSLRLNNNSQANFTDTYFVGKAHLDGTSSVIHNNGYIGYLELNNDANYNATNVTVNGNVNLTDNSSTNLNNLNVNGSVSLANNSNVTLTNSVVNGSLRLANNSQATLNTTQIVDAAYLDGASSVVHNNGYVSGLELSNGAKYNATNIIVNGNASLTNSSLDLTNGSLAGNLNATNSSINVSGIINGNVDAKDNSTLNVLGNINGSSSLANNSSAVVKGNLNQDLTVTGSTLDLTGSVANSVKITNSNLTQSNGTIGSDLEVSNNSKVQLNNVAVNNVSLDNSSLDGYQAELKHLDVKGSTVKLEGSTVTSGINLDKSAKLTLIDSNTTGLLSIAGVDQVVVTSTDSSSIPKTRSTRSVASFRSADSTTKPTITIVNKDTDVSANLPSSESVTNVNLESESYSLGLSNTKHEGQVILEQGAKLFAANGSSLKGNLEQKEASSFTLSNSQLNGDLTQASSATAIITNKSSLTGTIQSASNNSIALQNSQWTLTGDSKVGNLSLDKALVTLSNKDSENRKTLTIDGNLSGTGTFKLVSLVNNQSSDKIVVNGKLDGNYVLDIEGTGAEPVNSNESLTVLTTNGIKDGGNLSLTLRGSYADLGAYRYVLVEQGNNFGLARPEVRAEETSEALLRAKNDVQNGGSLSVVDKETTTDSTGTTETSTQPKEQNDLISKYTNTGLSELSIQVSLATLANNQALAHIFDAQASGSSVWVKATKDVVEHNSTNYRTYKQDTNLYQVGGNFDFGNDINAGLVLSKGSSSNTYDQGITGTTKYSGVLAYLSNTFSNSFKTTAYVALSSNNIKIEANNARAAFSRTLATFGANINKLWNVKGVEVNTYLGGSLTRLPSATYELDGAKIVSQRINLFSYNAGIALAKQFNFENGFKVKPGVEVSYYNNSSSRTFDKAISVNSYFFKQSFTHGFEYKANIALKYQNLELKTELMYSKDNQNGKDKRANVLVSYKF